MAKQPKAPKAPRAPRQRRARQPIDWRGKATSMKELGTELLPTIPFFAILAIIIIFVVMPAINNHAHEGLILGGTIVYMIVGGLFTQRVIEKRTGVA